MATARPAPREPKASERGVPAVEKSCAVCGATTALELIRAGNMDITVCVQATPCLARGRANGAL